MVRRSLGLLTLFLVFGCAGKPAPDATMTTSPTGLWVAKSNPDLSVNIDGGGEFKITRGAQETIGSWLPAGKSSFKVTLEGQTHDVPFQRKDLGLTLQLPGETAPTEFTQM